MTIEKILLIDKFHILGSEIMISSFVQQNLDMTCLSVAVAHFLNCLLSSSPNITVNVPDELKSTRSAKVRNV